MMSQRATFQTGVGVSKLSFSMEAVNRWLKMLFFYTLGCSYSYKKNKHQKQRSKIGFKYGTSKKQNNTYYCCIMINTFVYFFMLSTCEDRIFMKRDSSVRKRRLSSGAVWEQQESKELPPL